MQCLIPFDCDQAQQWRKRQKKRVNSKKKIGQQREKSGGAWS